MLDRAGEVERIGSLLEAARAGAGAALVVEGDAGIGKTTLLRAAADAAAGRGFKVLSARGGELEREFAHGVVRQLLERELATATDARRARLLAGAARLAEPALLPPGHREAAGAPDAFARQHGLYWLLSNLADERPLAVLVDDLHWADAATVRFLAYLARRLEDLSIALVAAVRLPEGGAATGVLATLRADPLVARVELGPLSEGAITRLAADMFERDVAPEFARACRRISGGNPFLVTELIATLSGEGVTPAAEAVARVSEVGPAAIAHSVLLRVGRLSPAAVSLAQAVAVLGSGAEIRHAAALAELELPQAQVAADALVGARILAAERPLRFRHPLVRQAIYQELAAGRRALDHARAARLLVDDGADLERVAGQLLLADTAGDPWVAARLRDAAADASARGAPEAAAQYLRRALAEPPPDGMRAQVLHELGSVELRIGEHGGTERLRAALELTGDPRERAPIAIELASMLTLSEGAAAAVGVLDDAIAALDAGDPLARALEATLLHAAQFDIDTSSIVDARLPGGAGELRGATADERLVLATLAYRHTLHGDCADRAAELAERAIARGALFADQSSDILRSMYAVYALLLAERFAAADAAIEQFMAHARAYGSLLAFQGASALRRDLNYRLGRLADAEADGRAAYASARTLGVGDMGTLSELVDVLVLRGDTETAARALGDSDLAAWNPAGSGIFELFFLHGRAALRVAPGPLPGRAGGSGGARRPSAALGRESAAVQLARARRRRADPARRGRARTRAGAPRRRAGAALGRSPRACARAARTGRREPGGGSDRAAARR